MFGGVLLSHTLSSAVPSALEAVTTGFGMGPGVSLPLSPPNKPSRQFVQRSSQNPSGGPAIEPTVLSQNRIVCVSFCFHHNQCIVLSSRRLVPVHSTPYNASMSSLSTPSSTGRLTRTKPDRDLISKHASRLDAFSGYRSRT